MTLRNYSNTSVQTTLLAGIGAGDLGVTVADATGYPAAPFAIVVDPDVVASEEVMLVTGAAGPVWTVTRAYDGTTAKPHKVGATVIHAAIAADFVERVISSTYATGTLTLAVQPTDGDTITVGSLTYTYVNGLGPIAIGADLAETQANTVSAIGIGIDANLPDAGALPFSGDMSILVAAVPGTAGNGVVTTATFTDPLNFFGQGALTGGTDGTTDGHIQAQSATLTGASPASPALIVQAAPGMDYLSSQGNIFEIQDKAGGPILNVDSGGNFYTFYDLRLVDPSHAAIFRVGADKTVYIRVADVNDAFRVFIESSLVFAIRPNATTTARFTSSGVGSVALEVDTFGQAGDNTDLMRALGTENYDTVFRLMQRGAVAIAQHVAPDDADLSAGQMALWFDQTDGAAQFMIKGKTADGTVVSGAVALT